MRVKKCLKIPPIGKMEGVGTISIKSISGHTYVYLQQGSSYSKEKKHSIPKTISLGSVCPDDTSMFYPNANYWERFPEEAIRESGSGSRCGCLHVGTYFVIKKILSEAGLDEIIGSCIKDKPGLFLDLIAYSIVTENNAGQYYPDYAYDHPLFTKEMHQYSDSTVSSFLNDRTIDENLAFQNAWNALKDHRERIYISYDSTNKVNQAGDIDLVETGHSKTGENLPILNYAVAYDRNNREPLFYEAYPGSIVDVSQLHYTIDKAVAFGYRKIGFVLDRGYFSKENIRYLDKCGYQFVIMVKGLKPLVSALILENKGKFEEKRECGIREYQASGITVPHPLYALDDRDRYFHIYYSSKKYAAEREDLEANIDRMAKELRKLEGTKAQIDPRYSKYFDIIYHHEGKEDQTFVCARERTDVINKEISLCGYFSIITSEKMNARDALLLYKSRDGSEKLFRGDKSYLGNRSTRNHHNESVNAKIFVEFAALIVRNRIYTSLKDEMVRMENRPNYMTVPAAVKELEKINIIRGMDGRYRLDHAITKTQNAILKAFGLSSTHIKTYVRELSDALAKLENVEPKEEPWQEGA